MNGPVDDHERSGSVVANSMNGKMTVSLNHVTPNKTMSFSTMNGTIDVTLPADVKANLKMKTDNGDIYTDFDVKLDAVACRRQWKTAARAAAGIVCGWTRRCTGRINGGGPEMQFTTFNGNILIHKK